MAESSPWGEIQYTRQVTPGVRWEHRWTRRVENH